VAACGDDRWQLSIFSLVFGACYGGFVALYAALTIDYFGARNASSIIGTLYTEGAAGNFLGPLFAGHAFDMLGSYTMPIAIGPACAALAGAILTAAPEPRKTT
jgi:MFS transporter, OFA family, oxalate/formate antiporter